MRFPADAERFLLPGCERLVALSGLLASRSLRASVVKTGAARHIALRLGRGKPVLALAAHYDRVAGSPGVLDNSCACLQLVDFAARRAREGGPPLLVLFTDAEENPGARSASGQGSFALARALRAVGKRRGALADFAPPVLVLDVTGRGDRLLISSAPASLLTRNGLGGSPAAAVHAALADLASAAANRAGLEAPRLLALPWSDDLGLVLGGLGALTVSLLPAAEAELLVSGGKPPTWDYLHGPGDGPELAQEGSFAIVARFLDAIVAELERGRIPGLQ